MVLRTYQRFEAYQSERYFNPTLRNLMAIAEVLATTVSALTVEPTEEEIEALGEANVRRVWRDGKLV